MNKIKDWMARNQDDVSEWSDISICVLVLFQKCFNEGAVMAVIVW